jgi:hypothetical protein
MRSPVVAAILICSLVAGCTGFLVGRVSAAPRTGQERIVSGVFDRTSHWSAPAPSGVPSPGGAPLPAAVMQPSLEESVPAAFGGTATWCAPTPRYCQNWGRPAMVGAMESFRWGDEPYQVRVRHGDHSTVVTVVSHCTCPRTLIDLSVEAFDDLAPLSRGRIDVSVEVLDGAQMTLPPTDDGE